MIFLLLTALKKRSLAWFILWFIWDALVFTSAVFAGICVFRVRLFYSTLLARGGELTPSSFLPSVRDGIADRRGNVL